MNELKFNSQICTSVEQSQRLLELGLKPETSDMYIYDYVIFAGEGSIDDIPSWSLHRLIEILPCDIKPRNCYYSLTFDKNIVQYERCEYGIEVLKSFSDSINIYDNIIDCIAWLIKETLFNKEYLKQ